MRKKKNDYEADYDFGYEEDSYTPKRKFKKEKTTSENLETDFKKDYVPPIIYNRDLQIFNEFQEHLSKKRTKNVKIFNIVFTIFGILLVVYGIFTMINK